eukprot:2056831-Pleurochrysis_carterae.AAC.1
MENSEAFRQHCIGVGMKTLLSSAVPGTIGVHCSPGATAASLCGSLSVLLSALAGHGEQNQGRENALCGAKCSLSGQVSLRSVLLAFNHRTSRAVTEPTTYLSS